MVPPERARPREQYCSIFRIDLNQPDRLEFLKLLRPGTGALRCC